MRSINTGRAIPESSAAPTGAGTAAATADNYLGRLVKYIPAEIVALYLGIAGVIPKLDDGNTNYRALWIIFLITQCLVPIYLFLVTKRERKKPLWPQIFLSTIAFPIWVFALGGPFESLPWYRSWIASVTLMFVTFVFGIYQPPLES